MAQKFLRKTIKGAGAAGSALPAVPVGKAWIVLAANIANASGTAQQTVRLTYNDGTNEIEIIPTPGGQVAVGGSIDGISGKDVLLPGDVVKVYVASGTADVWFSYMEIDQP